MASAAEREELMQHIADKPELRKELDAHTAIKAVTDGWLERLQYDLALDEEESDPMSRIQNGIGITLFVVGIAILKGIVGIRWRVLGTIIIGWLATPVLAGIICFFGLFFLQNVFQQAVV